MTRRYQKSEALLDRALKTIPLASQTFSKSLTQFPRGAAPFFIQRAKGSRVWDVDDNEYVDCINSLAAVTLGYCDPDVTAAVKAQLEDGVIFSLPHPIESRVAELIVEMVPCAQMVRFGKNGSDATSGAIRLARAFTGRDHVAMCGYHGWQDWSIGTTARSRGVPKATRDLTHSFAYNDLASLEAVFKGHPDQVAAVILEPMNVSEPKPGFLQSVQDLARRHKALLIFDETITGFRFANGGAQQLFGVTPDLATFGKGLANGYPVSAIAGRADVMKLMAEIFFSFTFGGETLSLAAAEATLTKLKREPVIERIWRRGDQIVAGIAGLIEKNGLQKTVSLAGKPCWSFFLIQEAGGGLELKTLFIQEMLERGVLAYGTHNVSYAYDDADIAQILAAYGEVLPILREAIDKGDARARLRCEPLVPLFKVR